MSQNQLQTIRETLKSMEEPIIFSLAERARYKFYPENQQIFHNFWKEQNEIRAKLQTSQINADYMRIFCQAENKLLSFYFSNFLPVSCGSLELPTESAFFKDLNILFNISERMRLGINVAVAKFQANPELYRKLAADNNIEEINKQLTNNEVEQKILQRVGETAKRFDFVNPLFSPQTAMSFFKDCIIPLTKEIELEYLLSCK